MHYLASVSGHEHFLAKDPLPSGHQLHLANVPGYEHLLAKDPLPPPPPPHLPPPGISTFGLNSARYAINIRIAFLFMHVFGGHMYVSGATGSPTLDFWRCLFWILNPEWVLPYRHCVDHTQRTFSEIHLWCYPLPTT